MKLIIKTAILAAIAILLPDMTQAQTSVALSPVPAQQFFSQAGQPLASGCIFTYITGTSTPLATYTSFTGITQNTNPIILDGGGFAQIWLSNSTYRFVIFANDGLNDNCASGALQRTIDGISAYTIINQAQNLFLSGQSSDPSGTAGELYYNTTIPCFRGFTTFWDCFVTLTAPQTLTNKTLTAPTITSPTTTGTDTGTETLSNKTLTAPSINGYTIGTATVSTGNPTNFTSFTNDTVNGTTLNALAKLKALGTGATVVITTAGDIGGVEGITVAGAGTIGSALIMKAGQVNCNFDGSTTALDYVQISPTVNGDCHDTGSTAYPTGTGQVLGRVLTTNAGVGNYLMDLFGPEINSGTSSLPHIIYNTPSTATNGSIGTTAMVTAPASGATYRFSVYGTVTVIGAACTGASTVNIQVNWQDPNEAALSSSSFFTLQPTGGNNGTVGRMNLNVAPNPIAYGGLVRSKGSTAISYLTTYTAGLTCAPAPLVQLFPILEQVTAN